MNVGESLALVALHVTCLCRDRERKEAEKPVPNVQGRPATSHKNHVLSTPRVGNVVFNISHPRSASVSAANCHEPAAICPVSPVFSHPSNVLGDTSERGNESPDGTPRSEQGLSAQRRSQAARCGSAAASGARRARRGDRSRRFERIRSPRSRDALSSARFARLRSDPSSLRARRARARRKLRLPSLWMVAPVPRRWHVPALSHVEGGAPC